MSYTLKKREGVPEMGTKPLKALRGYRASNRGSNRGARGCMKDFLCLERPFLDLVSQTPRPRAPRAQGVGVDPCLLSFIILAILNIDRNFFAGRGRLRKTLKTVTSLN